MKAPLMFRAYDLKDKKWLLGYDVGNLGGFSIAGEVMLMGEWNAVLNRFLMERGGDRTWKDLAIDQFTGLKDVNGKDIYEGDIVRFQTGNIVNDRPVVWNPAGMWSIGWSDGPNSGPMRGRYAVIGNVHEDPELIA